MGPKKIEDEVRRVFTGMIRPGVVIITERSVKNGMLAKLRTWLRDNVHGVGWQLCVSEAKMGGDACAARMVADGAMEKGFVISDQDNPQVQRRGAEILNDKWGGAWEKHNVSIRWKEREEVETYPFSPRKNVRTRHEHEPISTPSPVARDGGALLDREMMVNITGLRLSEADPLVLEHHHDGPHSESDVAYSVLSSPMRQESNISSPSSPMQTIEPPALPNSPKRSTQCGQVARKASTTENKNENAAHCSVVSKKKRARNVYINKSFLDGTSVNEFGPHRPGHNTSTDCDSKQDMDVASSQGQTSLLERLCTTVRNQILPPERDFPSLRGTKSHEKIGNPIMHTGPGRTSSIARNHPLGNKQNSSVQKSKNCPSAAQPDQCKGVEMLQTKTHETTLHSTRSLRLSGINSDSSRKDIHVGGPGEDVLEGQKFQQQMQKGTVSSFKDKGKNVAVPTESSILRNRLNPIRSKSMQREMELTSTCRGMKNVNELSLPGNISQTISKRTVESLHTDNVKPSSIVTRKSRLPRYLNKDILAESGVEGKGLTQSFSSTFVRRNGSGQRAISLRKDGPNSLHKSLSGRGTHSASRKAYENDSLDLSDDEEWHTPESKPRRLLSSSRGSLSSGRGEKFFTPFSTVNHPHRSRKRVSSLGSARSLHLSDRESSRRNSQNLGKGDRLSSSDLRHRLINRRSHEKVSRGVPISRTTLPVSPKRGVQKPRHARIDTRRSIYRAGASRIQLEPESRTKRESAGRTKKFAVRRHSVFSDEELSPQNHEILRDIRRSTELRDHNLRTPRKNNARRSINRSSLSVPRSEDLRASPGLHSSNQHGSDKKPSLVVDGGQNSIKNGGTIGSTEVVCLDDTYSGAINEIDGAGLLSSDAEVVLISHRREKRSSPDQERRKDSSKLLGMQKEFSTGRARQQKNQATGSQRTNRRFNKLGNEIALDTVSALNRLRMNDEKTGLSRKVRRRYNNLLEEGETMERKGNLKGALDCYLNCIALYDGDAALTQRTLALATSSGCVEDKDFKRNRSISNGMKTPGTLSDQKRRKSSVRGGGRSRGVVPSSETIVLSD